MRWLAQKDLRILGRSPLLVATLILYPAIVALLIGLALSRGPDKPRVAIVNEVPTENRTVRVGSAEFDTQRYERELLRDVDAVRVGSRAEARKAVKDGDAVAAIVIPRDLTERLTLDGQPRRRTRSRRSRCSTAPATRSARATSSR